MVMQLAVGRTVGAKKDHLNMSLERRTLLAAPEMQKES